ncbi:hypothetical protein [Gimesia fumaroli]|uniref:hypothetical protein n=1 Tax=Gimesia fumaroli TaxID=2527976 RepID=UPI0011A0EEF0|nr:hypothetical protein [Gimesia fumaroli]
MKTIFLLAQGYADLEYCFRFRGIDCLWHLGHRECGFSCAVCSGKNLFIGAADLIPEIKKSSDVRENIAAFVSFFCGLAVLLALRICFPQGH